MEIQMKTIILGLGIVTLLLNFLSAQSQFGNVLSTDGYEDYVIVSNASDYSFGQEDFTVEFWVNKRMPTINWTNTYGISKWNTGSNPGSNEWTLNVSTSDNNNIPCFSIESGTTRYRAESPENISVLTWTHLAGVRDSAYIKLYVNGNIVDSVNVGDAIINNAGRELMFLFHDYQNPALHFYTQAYIDEVRIWNYARSLNQLKSTMNDTLGPEYYSTLESGLIGYWRFEQLEDLGINSDGNDDVNDYSSMQNHADTYGNPIIMSWISSDIQNDDNRRTNPTYCLGQNYPNPFNPNTIISYTVGAIHESPLQTVQLSVYNVLGQKVRTLVDEQKSAGVYHVTFNGSGLAGGIYFYQIKILTNHGYKFTQTRKLILIK